MPAYSTDNDPGPGDATQVAAHSAFLLATFNAILTSETEEARGWFGTGEMRTMMLSWK